MKGSTFINSVFNNKKQIIQNNANNNNVITSKKIYVTLPFVGQSSLTIQTRKNYSHFYL